MAGTVAGRFGHAATYDLAVDTRRYRQITLGAVASLIALIASVWAVNPRGEDAPLPAPVESVFPLPGDTVVRQTALEIDLPVGYSLDLNVDGVTIPQAEIGSTPSTGRYIWQPGPFKLFETWGTGDHTITIRWDRVSGGGPDPGEFTWKFRVI